MTTTPSQEARIPARTYIAVWAVLIALTVITLIVSRVDLGYANVIAALAIASVKASAVLAIFMHLKYEDRLFRIFLAVALVTVAVIIGLTFTDYSFR